MGVEILPRDCSPLDPEPGLGDRLSVFWFCFGSTSFYSWGRQNARNSQSGTATLNSLTWGSPPVTKECSSAKNVAGPKLRDSNNFQAFHTIMQEIIQQVGELLLGSVPTVLLFILLVLSYQFLVQGPLGKTLRERRARTAGAVEEAHKAIAAAEAKASSYADRLRLARAELFKLREQRIQTWTGERDAAVASARDAAAQRVAQAKKEILTEAAIAKNTLSAGADQLAEQVVRAVMPATAGGSR